MRKRCEAPSEALREGASRVLRPSCEARFAASAGITAAACFGGPIRAPQQYLIRSTVVGQLSPTAFNELRTSTKEREMSTSNQTTSSSTTVYHVTILFGRNIPEPARRRVPTDAFDYFSATTVTPHDWGVQLEDADDSTVCYWPWREIVSVNVKGAKRE